MQIINRLLFVIVMVLVFAGMGCHGGDSPPPDPNPTKPDYDFSQVSKDYLYFLPNSYWIFQNDTTLNAFTIKLFSAREEIRHSGDGSVEKYTYNAYWMFYSENEGYQKSELFATNFKVGEGVPNSIERIYFTDSNYKIAFAPMFPFGQRVVFGGIEGTFINKEFLDTMNLNGKLYSEVYHSISEDSETEAPDTIYYHFYFAKHFGLIKYSIIRKDQTMSYSLIEANVLQ